MNITGLSVSYPAVNGESVLSEVAFSVFEGEKIALLGANGAGKSTLFLTILGILKANAGTIEVDGDILDKKNLPLIRRKVGLLFQDTDDQLFMPTVYDNVIFGIQNYEESVEKSGTENDAGNHRKETKAIADTASEILGKFEILHLKDRMSRKLSGGERRLAALASVLVMEPSVLLMDEPSTSLDPRSRRRLIAILKNLPQAYIIATHDMDLALELCDRCMLLYDGRIYADGPIKNIINDKKLLYECGM